jgi:hypothetical protein
VLSSVNLFICVLHHLCLSLVLIHIVNVYVLWVLRNSSLVVELGIARDSLNLLNDELLWLAFVYFTYT